MIEFTDEELETINRDIWGCDNCEHVESYTCLKELGSCPKEIIRNKIKKYLVEKKNIIE